MYKFKVTGPFQLTDIDNTNARYLLLTFSDGYTRKLAKSGNWPPEYAEALLEKSIRLKNQSVYIKTSQTTKEWETTEWLCDIRLAEVTEKSRALAQELSPDAQIAPDDSIEKFILISSTSGKTFYANAEPIIDFFKKEDDFLDFSQSFEQGFVSAWSAKNARSTKLPEGVKRVRIGGLGQKTKRNGFRVVASEVATDNTSEAFKFFHLLRIDDKQEHEDYLSDAEIREIIERRKELEQRYPKGVVSWMEH
ncbi:MAG: hypothetical protein ACK5RP_03965 [Betaproteobacteria bacterium]|jgi:hypothetical protein